MPELSHIERIRKFLSEIEERHPKITIAGASMCRYCTEADGGRYLWPCDAIRLARMLREALGALEKAATRLRLSAGVIQLDSARDAGHGFADEADAALSRLAQIAEGESK